MTNSFSYGVFGLRVRSEIELPELAVAEFSGEHDVSIELSSLPPATDVTAELSVEDECTFLNIRGVARYRVSSGAQILVDPEPGVPARNVRLYLLGSAMGLLLHQRGDLPLHANAVEIDGRAFAFMGHSGAGKSTLAAAFHDRGYRVIADDVCVIRFDGNGQTFVCPGIPRLRLWDDALMATGREETLFERSYAGDDDYKKYDVPIPAKAECESASLTAIYLLDRGDTLTISAVHGAEAVDAVFANTYRGRFVRSTGNSRAHWAACLRLVREVPIFKLERPWGHDRLSGQIEGVLEHARSSIVPLRQ